MFFNLFFKNIFYIFAKNQDFYYMANMFLKKTMASMLNMPSEQVEAILNAAEAFKSNEIDRNLAIKLFDKFSKKSPKEINEILRYVDENFK